MLNVLLFMMVKYENVLSYLSQNCNGKKLYVSCRTIEIFKILLGTLQKSNFNLIKVHNMKHYASSIRRSGAPVEYSTNMYEHLHIAIVKTGYRISNRKNFLDHIVKYNRRLEALRKDAMRNGAYSHSIGKNATLDKVHESGILNILFFLCFYCYF